MAFKVILPGTTFKVPQSGIRVVGFTSTNPSFPMAMAIRRADGTFRLGSSFTDAGTSTFSLDDPRMEFTMTYGEEVYTSSVAGKQMYIEY